MSIANIQRRIVPVAMRVVGAVLVFAASLKALEVSNRFPLLWKSSDALVAVGGVLESVFGACLLTGVRFRFQRAVGIALFACLSAYAAAAKFSGARSCGCFGAMQVDPSFTLLFDLLACSAFVISPVQKSDENYSSPHFAVATIVACLPIASV